MSARHHLHPALPHDSTPSLLPVPIVRAVLGHAHDPNPVHRRSMEDTLSAVAYHSFPGLFLGLYDGHGGLLAASILEHHLHKLFLDDLLALDHHPLLLQNALDPHPAVPATPPPSDGAPSTCSTPPYDLLESTDDDELDALSSAPDHPLNTPALDVARVFKSAYAKMDAVLKTRRCCRTGATAVTCFLRKVPGYGRVLTTANCGDARAVLSRAGRPVRLSTDHRPVDESEANRIIASGGFIASQRVSGILNVSRAFGDHSLKSVVISDPDVNEVVLNDMDEFVVLACDGLWDFVDELRVIRLAQECFDRGFNSREVADTLVREALLRKSTDNISVMVVQFDLDDE